MNTNVNKKLCDAVMYYIQTGLKEATNPAAKKFGRKVMHDSISMWLDFSLVEFNVAIQWLIDKKHIKPLGQHTVGLGTGQGIKKYDLNGFTPYKRIDPNLAATEQQATVPEKPTIVAKKPAGVIVPIKNDDIPSFTGKASPVTADHIPEAKKMIEDKPSTAIDDALLELEHMIKRRHRIKALEQKLNVLDRLSTILPSDIGDVLTEIKNDLQEQVK